MPKGLKETSQTIAISADIVESAANTFTEVQVDLNLDPLNNEVFVITAIDMQSSSPDMTLGQTSAVFCGMSTTTRTSVASLADSNGLARLTKTLVTDPAGGPAAVGFIENSAETPTALQDYVAIIATNDFFLQIQGQNNVVAKNFQARMWGYRARADSSVYAALVQSEVLSA